MRNKIYLKQSFTLIEVLITLAIVGILSVVGYANYREFGRKEAVTSATRQIVADLRYAQELALSGHKPDGPECGPSETLVSVDFTVVSSDEYRIEVVCTGGGVVVRRVGMRGIELSAPAPNPISFLPLSSGTNAVNAVIGICLGDRGSAVGVTAGGKINESDFSCP